MTKKFWRDWQKRANTTDVIVLFVYRNDGTIYNRWGRQIEGIIQSVEFDGNYVKIHHQVWWVGLNGRHYESRTTTVHRKNIKTVIFNIRKQKLSNKEGEELCH